MTPTNDADAARIDDSTRQQVKVIVLFTDNHCMTSVVSTLDNITAIRLTVHTHTTITAVETAELQFYIRSLQWSTIVFQ